MAREATDHQLRPAVTSAIATAVGYGLLLLLIAGVFFGLPILAFTGLG